MAFGNYGAKNKWFLQMAPWSVAKSKQSKKNKASRIALKSANYCHGSNDASTKSIITPVNDWWVGVQMTFALVQKTQDINWGTDH